MHDKHGREIRVGDLVLVRVWNMAATGAGNPHGGYVNQPARVVRLIPDATSCNIVASYPVVTDGSFNACESEVIGRADGQPLEVLAASVAAE